MDDHNRESGDAPIDPVEALDELDTRLTYLEAFAIATFIMFKEHLTATGVPGEDLGRKFQMVFREAMRFLDGPSENDDERSPHWTAMDEARKTLDTLMERVEQGKRPPQAPPG